jgi:hypothetical protein
MVQVAGEWGGGDGGFYCVQTECVWLIRQNYPPPPYFIAKI